MDTTSALGSGTEGRARWSLRLLGGFELSALPGGERVTSLGKRERVLLAYLALSPKGSQQRRKLTTLLWGDAADETTLDNLRRCLWGLRKALGDDEHRTLASEGEDIVLDTSAFEIDALAFCRLAVQSGMSELEAAANLYNGEFLDGLGIESEEFETWRRGEALRYRDQAVDVLTRLMTQLCEHGEAERAIATGGQILRLDPLHEEAVRRLMRLYGESGRRGAALQLYRTFADALRTDLDAQPDAETRLVFAQIAHGGEERTSDPAAVSAKPLLLSTSVARLNGEQSLPAPTQPASGSRAPLALLTGVLIVAIALISYQRFVLTDARNAAATEPTMSASQASATSIVVLPFANLSGDSSQEFFSDGMTEEITAALAKVPSLRVVARTSAFQFKGQNQDVRMVAQSLGASHLLEGSVRKNGNRVRISAQLIEGGSGTHLWSENYDQEFTDIFAIQENIATAIARALHVPLNLAPGVRLVSSRSADPESYQQYLRARALIAGRGLKGLTDAIALLEQVVAHEPNFAPAWSLLAQAYDLTPNNHPAQDSGSIEEFRNVVDASLPKAEAAGRRAIQLDASYTGGYLILGLLQHRRGKWLLSEEFISKALEMDPNNPDALQSYSNLLAAVGRLKEALAMKQRLRALEPFVPVFTASTAALLWLNGQNDDATAILKDLRPSPGLAVIHAAAGRYGEAADALLKSEPGNASEAVKTAANLLRTAPVSAVASPGTLPRLGYLGFVYLYVGAPDRVLEAYERNVEAGYLVALANGLLWHPSYAPARKTDRFKAYIRSAGLVDYWRVKGWPEFCRPTVVDDFVCA
jgi:TolB-like protein/DNA-binding SARP family transcriptional activator/Tfp pilus assembly protein PilF